MHRGLAYRPVQDRTRTRGKLRLRSQRLAGGINGTVISRRHIGRKSLSDLGAQMLLEIGPPDHLDAANVQPGETMSFEPGDGFTDQFRRRRELAAEIFDGFHQLFWPAFNDLLRQFFDLVRICRKLRLRNFAYRTVNITIPCST